MKISNINLILMLTSGIIVGIIGIYYNYPLDRLTYTLLIVLILFYIIGTVLGILLNKVISSADNEEKSPEDSEEENQDEELDMDEAEEEMSINGEDNVVSEDSL